MSKILPTERNKIKIKHSKEESRVSESLNDFTTNKKVLLRQSKRHTARAAHLFWFCAVGGYLVLARGVPQSWPVGGVEWGSTSDRVPLPHPGRTKDRTWNRTNDRTVVPPPPLFTERQTPVKTLPSRRTTYAAGKKMFIFSFVSE